jgi:hypothetical protein
MNAHFLSAWPNFRRNKAPSRFVLFLIFFSIADHESNVDLVEWRHRVTAPMKKESESALMVIFLI